MPGLLQTLLPDCLHRIVQLTLADLSSSDRHAALSAQEDAAALRLTCRALKRTVDSALGTLSLRVTSAEDVSRAAGSFSGGSS